MLKVLIVRTVRRVPVLRVPRVLKVLAVLMVLGTASAAGSERYALIITGAHGEPGYADQYAQWRQAAVTALLEKLAFDQATITTLFDGGDASHEANAGNVRRVLGALRTRVTSDDVLLVFLIGH